MALICGFALVCVKFLKKIFVPVIFLPNLADHHRIVFRPITEEKGFHTECVRD
jgi:hypothetical protein